MNKITGLKLTYSLQFGLVANIIWLDVDPIRNQLCDELDCELLGCMSVLTGIDVWYNNNPEWNKDGLELKINSKCVGNVAILLGYEFTALPLAPDKLLELLELTNKLQIHELEYA